MWNRVPYGFSWEISTHAWKNLQQICLWKINTSTWNNLVREKNTPAWKNLLRGCAYKLPQFPGLISPWLPLVRTITWLCNLIVLTAYILKYKSYKVCFQPFDKKMPSYQIKFGTNCFPFYDVWIQPLYWQKKGKVWWPQSGDFGGMMPKMLVHMKALSCWRKGKRCHLSCNKTWAQCGDFGDSHSGFCLREREGGQKVTKMSKIKKWHLQCVSDSTPKTNNVKFKEKWLKN